MLGGVLLAYRGTILIYRAARGQQCPTLLLLTQVTSGAWEQPKAQSLNPINPLMVVR